MRYILLIPVLFFIFAFGGDTKETGIQPVDCIVKFCRKQQGLAPTEARIEFFIKDSKGKPVKDSVLMTYNKQPVTLFPDSAGKALISVEPGRMAFIFFYNNSHQEIYSDSIDIKGGCRTGIELQFLTAEIHIIVDKPVIYFYPEQTEKINVELNVNGTLGFTYPNYNAGWNFTADSTGTLHMNGKEYDYLFWDAKTSVNTNDLDLRSGFIVSKDSLTTFFENQLSTMGLNPREQQDFITYWCPLMQENKLNYIHFMFNDECNSIASMNISPNPDHIFRVYMLWSNSSEMNPSSVHPQEVETSSRKGFDVLEWGGAKMELPMKSLSIK